MKAHNLSIAEKWLAAFNNKKIDDLLQLYSENAEHFSPKLKLAKPETNGLIKGQKALSDWWQDAFERLPELHYEPLKLTADDDCVFMEYTRQVPGEQDLSVAEVLHIRNGKIVYSRVYHG